MVGIVVFSIAVDYMWQLWHVEWNRHRTLARSMPETHNDGSHTDVRSFVGNLLALRRIILEPSIRNECTRVKQFHFSFVDVPSPPSLHTLFLSRPFQRSIPWFRLCFCVPSSCVTLFRFDGIRFSLSFLSLFISVSSRCEDGNERTHSQECRRHSAGLS